MKKGLGKLLPLLFILLLSACTTHRHSWQEANCENPRICTGCGETEGEPLGHEWQEADCENPRCCLRCGKTEGEPLGHMPTEANFQEAARCLRCGRELEPKLEAGFEAHGIRCEAENGVPHAYISCARNDTTPISGWVTFTEDPDEQIPLHLEQLDGYEWRYVAVSLKFDDPAAIWKNVRWSITSEDYYTIEAHDESLHIVDGGCDGFSVSYRGEIYPDCLRYYEYDNGHWDTSVYYVDYLEWFRVPEGYDGVVVGVRDSSIEWGEGQYIYDVINENAVFYRLS